MFNEPTPTTFAPSPNWPPKPLTPLPMSEWPLSAKFVAHFRTEADKGIGDTIAKQLGTAGELFKAAVKKLGIDCGCSARQASYNERYPYPPSR